MRAVVHIPSSGAISYYRDDEAGADLMLRPELSLISYPPEDLLLRIAFYAKSQ
jgi:predicted amidohydrolase